MNIGCFGTLITCTYRYLGEAGDELVTFILCYDLSLREEGVVVFLLVLSLTVQKNYFDGHTIKTDGKVYVLGQACVIYKTLGEGVGL